MSAQKSFGGYNPKGFIRYDMEKKNFSSNWMELMKNFNILTKTAGYWDHISGATNPGSVPVRDTNGRIQAADPAAPQDLVTVNYLNNTASSTSPTAKTLAMRDSSGVLWAADPNASDTQGVVTVNYLNNTKIYANTVAKTNVSAPAVAWTAIPLSSISSSVGSGWSINSSGQLVIPVAGNYIIVVNASAMNVSITQVSYYVNGALSADKTSVASYISNNSAGFIMTINTLNANSTLQPAVYNGSSSAVTVGGIIYFKVISQ